MLRQKFMSLQDSLFVWFEKTAVFFKKIMQFLFVKDLECSRPVQNSLCYHSWHYQLPFGLGGAVNLFSKGVTILAQLIASDKTPTYGYSYFGKVA